ncbi:Peptidase family S41 [Pedobacter caeni]|uniref:Peptidase family S41 n=1 Tax=Pedobacter caeni TaxID=288992 RepID=A0A1M4UFD0_9SPHI|nr:Peptidase family S41 [Pedobacter caeni]
MEKKAKLILIILGISLTAFARKKDNCDCLLNLKEIITDIEINYPGYKLKTSKEHQLAYLKVKKDAITDASRIAGAQDCFYTISKYLAFFKDNHIIFSDRKTNPEQNAQREYKPKDHIRHSDQLTGLWRRTGDSLTVKIIKQDQYTYRAYLWKTKDRMNKTGPVHFDLIGDENKFRIRKYSGWLTTNLLRGRRLNELIIEPDGIWEKVVPGLNHKMRETKASVSNKKFNHRSIDKNTYYLGIPAFDISEKKFDSLVLNQIIPDLSLNKIKHLIIDLRNNVGGNSSFLSLIRFIYEKPFALPGDFVYSSPNIIRRYQTSADAGSAYHQMMLPRLIANIGGFVQRDSLHIKLKETCTYPQTVSILVNENCASSTEYFLMLAKYSSKVKIFGQHTSGTLDYSELFEPEKLPCSAYRYMRPTTKSFYADTAPIDNKGITPDVNLAKYPDDEWVDIVIKINDKGI